MIHALLIDDDSMMASMLTTWLSLRGVTVSHYTNIGSGKLALHQKAWDILLLDLSLPDGDGLDLCKEIRLSNINIPILMLTARGDPMDKVLGLENGADDYLAKPFEPLELLARIRALLRRCVEKPPKSNSMIRFGNVEIDRQAAIMRKNGEVCVLTSHQFQLLMALVDNPDRIMSRDSLMQHVRGRDIESFDRSIDVHISRLRSIIEEKPKKPRWIQTVRGMGYVFRT